MAVDQHYVDRLVDWVTSEAAKLGGGAKGVNAFSTDSAVRLAAYPGLGGFSTTVVSRWINRQIKQGLKSKNLQRIGLLKGFSTDPAEAETLAYLWLSGLDKPKPADQVDRGEVKPDAVPAPQTEAIFDAKRIIVQIEKGLPAEDLVAIITASVEALARQSTAAPSQEKPEDQDKPIETPLTNVLRSWLSKGDKNINDLAAALNVSVPQVERILEGHPLTAEDCYKVAALTSLEVDTIVGWGACPELKPS
ncbi:hypothetical protein [Nodosilinea sp. LEGE 07298]|uniref:hypothetical protein n=1 Tax=Nodosilinea sp. LEGE 07298 TaxID=2777970 RepID=UPI001D15002B|nr:hypothetical protein [Nodosilinea sp. LEGE 07298]